MQFVWVCRGTRAKLRLAKIQKYWTKYDALGLGESLFASAPVREGFVRDESDQHEFAFEVNFLINSLCVHCFYEFLRNRFGKL